MRWLAMLALVAACGGSSTGPQPAALVFNLVNQSAETLKVELGSAFPPDTSIVMPGKSACLNYGSALYYPRGSEGFASVMIYPEYHLDRWFIQPTWGTGHFPQVTLTRSADHQFAWSVGASPCASPLGVTPGLSGVTARIHLTTAATTYPDSCAVNTGYKTLPDTLLTYSTVYNWDYDASTNTYYNRTVDLWQGFRDSVAVFGLKAHIISLPDTLHITWSVYFPGADSSFVSWQQQFRLICGSTLP